MTLSEISFDILRDQYLTNDSIAEETYEKAKKHIESGGVFEVTGGGVPLEYAHLSTIEAVEKFKVWMETILNEGNA